MIEEQFKELVETIREVRRKCPWDREQTHSSMRKYLIEECYEAVEAIDKGDLLQLREELGDLLIHIVFHSLIAEEEGAFTLEELLTMTKNKLIRRHPHVFGDKKLETGEQVLKQWEEIKNHEGRRSVLSGLPKSLPALVKAYRITEKAGAVGFDWEKPEEVIPKIEEEWGELRSALASGEGIEEEMGDLLFAIVNLCRHLKIDPESALEKTIERFIQRFGEIEKRAEEEGKSLQEMTLEEMDTLWEEAKEKLDPPNA